MHQSSYFSYDKNGGLNNARVTLSRKDPEGLLFADNDDMKDSVIGETSNALKLTDLSIGDMYSPQSPLTMLNQNGRGVMFTNQPLNRTTQFDRTTISGDVQPGWDIEIYRNEELLAFQQSNNTGRYEFNDVPLLSGLNLVKLVFYGPYGQTREEIRRILVNPNITKKGESYFRFLAMEQAKNLISSSNTQGVFTTSLLPGFSNTANTNTRGKERIALEYEYGIEDQLALYAQAVQVPISASDETRALTLGLGGVWSDIYGRVNVATSDTGGKAIQLISQTNLEGINLSLEHQIFNDFLSDFTEDINAPVTNRSIARADGSVQLPILPRLSIGLAAARTEYDSGKIRDELNQRTTTSLFGTASFNHNLLYTRDKNIGATTEQTRGNMLLSVPAFGAFLRGSVTYGIQPTAEWQSTALAVDYSIDEDLIARAEVNRDMSATPINTFTTSLTKRFDHFALGTNIGGDNKGGKFAGISLNFAIGEEPRTGKIRSYADPTSRSGILSTRSFIDKNNNNLFDDNEAALEGTRYLVNEGSGSRRSQDVINGVQLVKYVPTYEKSSITVDPSSLDDPFLVVGDSGVNVIARPGVPHMLDFAVHQAADVEGLITINRSGSVQEAANVLVEAVNDKDIVVRSARSAFDGVYLLELLPAGNYTLRISSEQADRLGFKTTTTRKLSVKGDEEYIQNMDLKVTR